MSPKADTICIIMIQKQCISLENKSAYCDHKILLKLY